MLMTKKKSRIQSTYAIIYAMVKNRVPGIDPVLYAVRRLPVPCFTPARRVYPGKLC